MTPLSVTSVGSRVGIFNTVNGDAQDRRRVMYVREDQMEDKPGELGVGRYVSCVINFRIMTIISLSLLLQPSKDV